MKNIGNHNMLLNLKTQIHILCLKALEIVIQSTDSSNNWKNLGKTDTDSEN